MENEHKLISTNPEVPGDFDDLLKLIETHNKTYENLSNDDKFELNQKILRLKLKLMKESPEMAEKVSDVPSLYKEGEHKGIISPDRNK